MAKKTVARKEAYEVSDSCSSPLIADAIKHSKKGKKGKSRGTISTTDMEFDPNAKRAFDENYDAIFGKKEVQHGVE